MIIFSLKYVRNKINSSCKTKLTQATRLNDQLLFNDDMLSCLSQQNFEKVVVLLQDEVSSFKLLIYFDHETYLFSDSCFDICFVFLTSELIIILILRGYVKLFSGIA